MAVVDPREFVPERIGDRYRVLGELGRGGMASVHRARDEVLQRDVAVKLLHAHLARDPAFLDRFRREAQAAASLAHPNVVAVHDWGEAEDGPYLVLQLIDGVSLRDLLATRGRLTAAEALAVLAPAAVGLGAAHQAGFVHRDVKPENILLGRDGSVRITDFGLARAAASATATFGTDVLVGSPHYLSPEAVRGEPLDARSDVYALGVVLFECLTGRPPFEGESPFATAVAHTSRSVPAPSAVRVGIAPELDALVLAATTINRDRRPDDGAAFAAALVRAVPDGPQTPDLSDIALPPGLRDGDGRVATALLPIEDTATVVSVPDHLAPRLPASLWRDPGGSGAGGSGGDGAGGGGAGGDTTPAPPWLTGPPDPPQRPREERGPPPPPQAGSQPSSSGLDTSRRAPDRPANRTSDRPPGSRPSGWRARRADRPNRVRRVLVVLLIVLALLGGSAGGGYLVWDRIIAPVTPIPPLIGASDLAARAALVEAGFEVAIAEQRPHHLDIPADHVLEQEPTGTARRGSVVALVLSAGPRQIAVPDVLGDDVEVARATIEIAGLTVTTREQHDEDLPAGRVLASEPDPGVVLDETSTVELVVSLGPRPIEVPDLLGVDIDEALATLDDLGLAGEVTARRHDADLAIDAVLTQDPDPGSVLTRGGVVTLTVSDGPEPVVVPNLRGARVGDAVATLEELGLDVEVERHGGFGAFLNPGRVFDQDPAAGAVRAPGDTVLLYAYEG